MYASTHNDNIGSISSGTMRTKDLLPAFLRELERQEKLTIAHKKLAKEISARMGSDDYYESEELDYDLGELFDALEEYCMPYFWFGAHPGDGADYGYWLSETFEEDFDDLKVSDLSEIPKNHTGEVLLINDHGNMTLYNCARGRLYEVWSIA